MSHEIEADFVSDYHNKEVQCHKCTSYECYGGHGFCSEASSDVPSTGHCDFFQSKD